MKNRNAKQAFATLPQKFQTKCNELGLRIKYGWRQAMYAGEKCLCNFTVKKDGDWAYAEAPHTRRVHAQLHFAPVGAPVEDLKVGVWGHVFYIISDSSDRVKGYNKLELLYKHDLFKTLLVEEVQETQTVGEWLKQKGLTEDILKFVDELPNNEAEFVDRQLPEGSSCCPYISGIWLEREWEGVAVVEAFLQKDGPINTIRGIRKIYAVNGVEDSKILQYLKENWRPTTCRP